MVMFFPKNDVRYRRPFLPSNIKVVTYPYCAGAHEPGASALPIDIIHDFTAQCVRILKTRDSIFMKEY